MKAIIYYIFLPLIYLVSFLPFWWLYRLSDILFFVVYHLTGYRKKVVYSNLSNSFPNKSEDELKRIQKKFYKHFCDLIFESLKTLTISPKTIRKRISFPNSKIFQDYYDKKQSVVVAMGHFGNWELGGARFAIEPMHKLYVIYHPLHNKHFDKLVYKMRTRLGNGLYKMKDTFRGMIGDKDDVTATGFIADQRPGLKGAHWMQFLNQDTPVFRGVGTIAVKMNYPVIYMGIKKVKRGYYEMKAETLFSNPSDVKDTEIIEGFTKRLEKDIQEMPENWLWTHKRWNHKREQSTKTNQL